MSYRIPKFFTWICNWIESHQILLWLPIELCLFLNPLRIDRLRFYFIFSIIVRFSFIRQSIILKFIPLWNFCPMNFAHVWSAFWKFSIWTEFHWYWLKTILKITINLRVPIFHLGIQNLDVLKSSNGSSIQSLWCAWNQAKFINLVVASLILAGSSAHWFLLYTRYYLAITQLLLLL